MSVPLGRSVSSANEVGCTGRRRTRGFAGSFFGARLPNSRFTSASAVGGSTSPAITRSALFGAYQVSWKLFSMRAVVFSNEGRVPSGVCS